MHECDGEQEESPIPQSPPSLPPSLLSQRVLLAAARGGCALRVWHSLLTPQQGLLLPHHGHPSRWGISQLSVSLFSKSIAVHFPLFKQEVTGTSCWAQQRLSSVALRTQRWFHKSHLVSVCILRKAFCIQPIPHVFRGRF